MNILIAGYPYVRENFLKTFRPGMEAGEVFALLPRLWTAKAGKVVFRPPAGKGVITATALFHHSNYPLIGGLLKGWMPALPLVLWQLRGKIDVLYSPSEPTLLTTLYQGIWAKLFGLRHVIFTWENVPYREKFSGFNLRAKELLIRLNCRLADGIICGNRKAQDIISTYTRTPAAVIPLSGVDGEFFKRPAPSDRSFAGHDLRAKIVFAFAGAIGYRKGVHLIIEALHDVVREVPQAVAIIAGSGEYESEIDAAISRNSMQDHVIRVPWVDHDRLRELLAAADAFLYPSIPHGGWEEQFGYSIAEASLMELPVISTKSGSIAELVQDGVTGILTDPGDKGQLTKAMIRLAHDPELRSRMGMAGRSRMIEQFSHQAVYRKFREFFNRIHGIKR